VARALKFYPNIVVNLFFGLGREIMNTSDESKAQPAGYFPPELIAEDCEVDGGSLYRFTFGPIGHPDLRAAFYTHVTGILSRMRYDHITINCPDGHPAWLTFFFRDLVGYGLPVEVTPTPTDPDLVQAIKAAARHTPFKWP
jgi:hypothetical protein